MAPFTFTSRGLVQALSHVAERPLSGTLFLKQIFLAKAPALTYPAHMLLRLRHLFHSAIKIPGDPRLLDPVRDRVSEAVLLLIVIFSLPTLAASLARSLEIGWQWYMWLHILSALSVWYVYVIKYRLTPIVKSVIIIILCNAIGYTGLLSVGLQSSATPLLLLASSLSVFLFHPFVGISLAFIGTLPIIVIAYLISSETVSISTDPREYGVTDMAWATYILVYILTLLAALAAIIIATKYLLSLLVASRAHETSLQLAIEKKTYQLRENEQRLNAALRITNVGSWFLNLTKNEVTWSSRLYEMFRLESHLPAPQLNEQEVLYTPESWQTLNSALTKLIEHGEPYELDLEIIRFDGSHGWILSCGEEAYDANGTRFGIQGTAQEITERKEMELKLAESASLDSLTNILNRRTFELELAQLIRNPRTDLDLLKLFLIDLDSFKKINDMYGHAAGDTALIKVAQSLKENTDKGDLIGRFGGDEFVVLFHQLPKEKVTQKADEILKSINNPLNINGENVRLKASIGVSHIPFRQATFTEILEAADEELYNIKRVGGDSFSIARKE